MALKNSNSFFEMLEIGTIARKWDVGSELHCRDWADHTKGLKAKGNIKKEG
jgi:hypothetical protein